jgi:hypothetical protein
MQYQVSYMKIDFGEYFCVLVAKITFVILGIAAMISLAI